MLPNRRALVLAVVVVSLVAIAHPWALYWLGLSNIEGRPRPSGGNSSCTDAERRLLQALALDPKSHLDPISPWSYEVGLLSGNEMQSTEVSAAWIVARHYNAAQIKAGRPLWWHLSGAALTIWLTRNWPTDKILCEASLLSASAHSI
jgi:hypothetical protein